MSSAAGRISTAAPGPSEPVTSPARPRTIATGICAVFPLTRSAAAAISSATAAIVTSSVLPNVSGWPRWSRSGASPAAPIAASVCPMRHGRPMRVGDDDADADAAPLAERLAQPPRRAVRVLGQQHHRARSGVGAVHPGGRQHQAVPGLDDPGPARAVPPPGPSRRRWRASRSARMTRPSALLMIFEVTTTMSPSRRSGGVADQPGEIGARRDLRQPGHAGDGDAPRPPPLRPFTASSPASDSAARAISAAAARSVM